MEKVSLSETFSVNQIFWKIHSLHHSSIDHCWAMMTALFGLSTLFDCLYIYCYNQQKDGNDENWPSPNAFERVTGVPWKCFFVAEARGSKTAGGTRKFCKNRWAKVKHSHANQHRLFHLESFFKKNYTFCVFGRFHLSFETFWQNF